MNDLLAGIVLPPTSPPDSTRQPTARKCGRAADCECSGFSAFEWLMILRSGDGLEAYNQPLSDLRSVNRPDTAFVGREWHESVVGATMRQDSSKPGILHISPTTTRSTKYSHHRGPPFTIGQFHVLLNFVFQVPGNLTVNES